MIRHCLCQSAIRSLSVVVVFLCPGGERRLTASNIPTVYLKAYEAIHAGDRPTWKGITDVDIWFQEERAAIEKMTLRWLAAAHDTVEWRRGLFLSRRIASPAICATVFNAVHDALEDLGKENGPLRSEDHAKLAGPILVLATCEDERVLPALHRLIADPSCPRRLIEEYLNALRDTGNATSIRVIQGITSRRTDLMLDRQAKLVERVLTAKATGEDIFKRAADDLRAVTHSWIEAIEAQDMEQYRNVLPLGFRETISEHDFKVELSGSTDLTEIIEAAKKAAEADDGAFQIDRKTLEATLIVEGRYKFIYVLEADGWKIFGPVRVGP